MEEGSALIIKDQKVVGIRGDKDDLTNVVIPNGINEIDNCVFWGCSGLTSLTLPKSLESVGERAFADCTELTALTLPNSLKRVGNEAFTGCSSLTSLALPDTLTSMGERLRCRGAVLASSGHPTLSCRR